MDRTGREPVDNNTIISGSNLGKRLGGIKKRETLEILYQGKSYPVACKITIGRDPGNHICIHDSMVSRYHALIQKIKDSYFVKDLNSTNGTFVNGGKVPGGKYLKVAPGDLLKIGRTEITVR